MTDLYEFSPQAIIAMGIKRIQPLVDKHGITSSEVLAACKRWGGMLDEVNYPDSTCRWCGVAVSHVGADNYYHVPTKAAHCWDGAPAVANPTDWKKYTPGPATPVQTTPSGVAFISTQAKKNPLQK